jgi:SSS family solute:Na+ symporter
MHVSLNLVDGVVLALYLAGLLWIGFRPARRTTENDIFLGGRSLRWWQIGFSLFSANAGPIMLIGFAGIGFSQGIVGSNFEWLAWVFILLLASVFIPLYLSTGISTMPQFLMRRYGKKSYDFLTIYSLVSILVVWLASALFAGGLLISQVFGCHLLTAMAVVLVIATGFTTLGGLRAVVRTGIFQSVIILASSVLLVILSLHRLGGVSVFLKQAPPSYLRLFRPASDPSYSWIAILAGYPVVAICYWCADQTIVQKVLAARNIREGQYGAIFLAALKIVMPFIFIFPGMLCYLLYRDQTNADNAYITLASNVMPHGLMGLCVAALIAALIDTVSSGLNSFSTVLTLDVVSRLRPLNDRGRRNTGRIATLGASVLVLALAILYSYSGKGFFELTQGLVSILAPPLSVVFLAGAAWKRATNVAAEWVLFGGGLLCLGVGACHVCDYPYKGFWPNFLLLSFYIFSFLSVVMIVVSLCTRQTAGEALPGLFRRERHSTRGMRLAWAALALIMAVIYLLFR